MAQASSRRKQRFHTTSNSSNYKSRAFQSLLKSPFRFSSGWLLCLIGMIVMLFWNWQLLLATVAGVGVMGLVYQMQDWDWQKYWLKWGQFFHGSYRQLFLAVGSGGAAAVSLYLATAIYLDSDSPWLATGGVLQGVGTFLTLALLLWQILSRKSPSENKFEQQLNHLTETDPLKRLIAVRQLTHLATRKRLTQVTRQQVVEYFHLMLAHEKEEMIREALWESLQILDKTQTVTKPSQPQAIQLPHLKTPTPVIHQP